ncbi:MAG: fibronectin type III domain-containing protein [Sphingobacteriales bacterium]|nr:fibronectin type III domain-containing protein [Sphingobacteriales bacterium]
MATIQIVVAQSTSVAVTDYSSQPAYRSGMIYLKLKDNAQIYLPKFKRGDKFDNYPVLKPFMNNYGISKVYRPFEKTKGIAFQHTYRVEFNPTADVEKLIRELTTLGMVEYAEKIPAEYTCFDPNDPKENDGSLWFLDKVKAYQAWDVTQGSGNVVVAVVDDAMYTTHEDLMANMWVNPDEIAGNGIDDDENGYIDDINGVDVADDDGNPNPPAALVSPSVFSHGSHCAGIVASVTNNGVGVASIGSHIKVMGVKATRDATSSPGMIEAGWEGIQYAVAEGATIISLSWGGTSNSQTYQNLINSIEAQGVLIFAAAGNSGIETPFYPAAYNYVVAVGATDQSDYKASYSNYGSWVDITAPGSYIHGILCTGPSNYGIKSGTSMATPMAASLAGLMKSYNPAITPAELRTCMYNSADNLDALNPTYVGKMGAGRINAQGAVVCALPSACITPYNLTTSNIVGTSAQLNWSGTAGSTYTVQAREVGTASWGTYSASGTSYTLPISACKNYEFKVMANCGGSGSSSYSAIATFSTTVGGPQNYCTQPTPSASFGWIQNVQFAGISNNSGNNSGYNNATCSVGSVTGGTSYPITLSPGFNSYAYNEYWRVYIDYNQDGDFTDSNELAYESGTSSTTTVSGNITIPSTALSGNTRMRVMMKWFGTGDMTLPVPCTAYNYGEVEEYTINVGSAVQSCLAPSSTATSSITASGATLSWAAVSGTTTYPVQYKATSSSTWITVNAAATSTTLSGLAASTTYEWKVAASCGTYSTPLTFTTSAVAVACSTPSSATVTSLTATTAGLSWSSVSGASNYAVRCRVLNSTWSADLTATSNTATLSQLSPATTYEYQVKTNCASGVSAYSSSVNFITATPSCSAPSALSTSGISTSGLTLNWGAVTGGLTYTVRYRVNGSTTWTTMPTTTSTTQAISGLAATTTYELQAGSTCSGATVNYSTSITATTATPCGTPSTLAASSITSSGATLTWAAVTGATTYTIQYKTSSSTTWLSTTSTTASKALTGLTASTAYDFKVMSTCSSGSSAYSAVSTFTTAATSSCGIPSGVVAGSITASNAAISWTAVSGATSYTIQYKLASGTIWSSTTATTNTKLLVGLVASTAYNVKVMSTCSSGSSAYSSTANFTTLATTTCGVPSGVTTSGISSTGATVSWTAVSSATSYTIQYKTSSATTWITTTATTASKALTGLAASTAYDVKVMSTCSGGSSAYSSVATFTTSAAAVTCGVPSVFNLGSITAIKCSQLPGQP